MTSPIEYAASNLVLFLLRVGSPNIIKTRVLELIGKPGGIVDSQPSVFLERYRQSCTNIGMLSPDQLHLPYYIYCRRIL